MAEGNKSIFSRRSNVSGSRPISVVNQRDTSSGADNKKNKLSFSDLQEKMKEDGSVEFEFDHDDMMLWEMQAKEDLLKQAKAKSLRGYQRRYEKEFADCYDYRDENFPKDGIKDYPCKDFGECVQAVKAHPTGLDKMEFVTEDGGVRKKILKAPPINADGVTEGCRVWIHYDMYLDKLRSPKPRLVLRDSTSKHELATSLEIGSDGIIGLQYGLMDMKLGEISELYITPEYAYGPLGIPGFMPKNQPIRMVVALLDVTPHHQKPLILMTPSERKNLNISTKDLLVEVDHILKAGNAKFENNLFGEAGERYQWALDLLKEHCSQDPLDGNVDVNLLLQVNHKVFKIYSNMAQCFLRQEKFEDAQEACEEALLLPSHPRDLEPKVRYRLAKAKFHQGNFLGSKQDCIEALRFCSWGQVEFRDLKNRAESAMERAKARANKEVSKINSTSTD